MFRPAARFLIGPRPPDLFEARFLAAVILPPLLFFAILKVLLDSADYIATRCSWMKADSSGLVAVDNPTEGGGPANTTGLISARQSSTYFPTGLSARLSLRGAKSLEGPAAQSWTAGDAPPTASRCALSTHPEDPSSAPDAERGDCNTP